MISRAISGAIGDHHQRRFDLPFGPGRRFGTDTSGLVGGTDWRVAVQRHHRRDSVLGLPVSARWEFGVARGQRKAAEERAVVRQVVRQQQHRAQQPASGRHVRMDRARHERLSGRQTTVPGRERADRAAMVDLVLQDGPLAQRRDHRVSRGDVQRVQRPRHGVPNTNPSNASFGVAQHRHARPTSATSARSSS